MSRKKLIIVGLVVLVILFLVLKFSRVFVGTSSVMLRDKNAVNSTTSQFGMGMNQPSSNFDSVGESTRVAPDIMPPTPNTPAVDSGRNIIQNSMLSMVVTDVEQSSQKIEQLAKDNGGFIANSSLSSYESTKQITNATLQARIPQDRLQGFLDTLKTYAVQVKSISTSSDDVTTQVRDLQAEISNLQEQETQLRAFFERTSNITQLLEVERELNRVRTQIDQKQGQLNYYERASALSTVTINLALDESQLPASPTDRFQPQAAWNAAVASLLGLLQNAAYAGIYLLVFSIFWLPLIIAITAYKKLHSKK